MMLVPSASTSPVVGRNRPAMILNSVDLPQPLGPIRLMSPPSGIVRDTGSRARTVRPSRLKIFETPRTSSLPAPITPAVSVMVAAALQRPEHEYGLISKPLSLFQCSGGWSYRGEHWRRSLGDYPNCYETPRPIRSGVALHVAAFSR